jgi:hypothetical protein
MRLFAASFVLCWILGVHAQGLIWTANHTASIGNTIGGGPPGSWQIAFDHAPDPFFPTGPSMNPVTGIFAMSLATNDSGHIFFANAQNEPRFDGFVAGLTDGANDYIRFQEFVSTWAAQSEANYLGRSAATPDLAGYNIMQIGFRVNSFYDYYDGTEDRYYRNLDYSLDFYGAPVPEPGTWALLALGGAAAFLLRRKARDRP